MKPLDHHLSTQPVYDDEGAIAAALEDVAVPALMACVVALTGDPSYVRGAIHPREWVMNEFQGKMTEAEKAELRRQALGAILAWRDSGCPAPHQLEPELLHEIMDWIACEPVPADYEAMYDEEMDLAGTNPRAIPVTEGPVDPDFSVLVIGCGESGLLAALRLKEAGIPFTVIEKNDDIGGTWLENRYPGCRVDVPSHYYSYSFGPGDEFSEYYAQRPEIYRYFHRFFEEHQLAAHVRWRCEVERATWDDDASRWHVTFRTADGGSETLSASAIVSGVGILNRPSIPQIAGLSEFDGPVFHSADWDDSVDLRGKRVALIGAGASGFQIGPAIADEVESLTVFQRTAQWMAPNPRYHAAIKPGERWAMRHLPGYSRWYRFMLMWQSSDKLLEMVRVDTDWHDFPRTANAMSAQRRAIFVKWIEDNIGDDPELLAKVTPTYPPMAKRMLQDNGSWLRCLKRPNVELITDRIVEITESGITTPDQQTEVDVIVLATGFRANEVLWPMEVIGRGGLSLADTWQGKPSGYRGVSVPGFPNFFILGGPGSGLAHAGSVILVNECQMRYIGDALSILSGGRQSIEPTLKAYERYSDDLQAEVQTLMWGHPSIENSWYKAADGKVYILCPWRLIDYWKMTAAVELSDHVIR